ncbi:unnamed protein product [Diplocarpon coronariae]
MAQHLLKFPLNLMLRGEILRLVRMGGDAASATQDTPPGSHRRNEVPSIDRWQRPLHEKYERDPPESGRLPRQPGPPASAPAQAIPDNLLYRTGTRCIDADLPPRPGGAARPEVHGSRSRGRGGVAPGSPRHVVPSNPRPWACTPHLACTLPHPTQRVPHRHPTRHTTRRPVTPYGRTAHLTPRARPDRAPAARPTGSRDGGRVDPVGASAPGPTGSLGTVRSVRRGSSTLIPTGQRNGDRGTFRCGPPPPGRFPTREGDSRGERRQDEGDAGTHGFRLAGRFQKVRRWQFGGGARGFGSRG